MFSKKMLEDIIAYCDYYDDGFTELDGSCGNAATCIYKAECDEIRYTYGCKPCYLLPENN